MRMENPNQRLRQKQNDFYIAPRTAHNFKIDFRSEKRLGHVPTRDEHYNVKLQEAICPCGPKPCHHLFEVRTTTSRPLRTLLGLLSRPGE